jgi:hypothetical protein
VKVEEAYSEITSLGNKILCTSSLALLPLYLLQVELQLFALQDIPATKKKKNSCKRFLEEKNTSKELKTSTSIIFL